MPRCTSRIEDGTRQGRTFLRVGAGTQFIQQHQRGAPGFEQDAHNVADMPGKSGKRLLDGLLIADISEDIGEKADLGPDCAQADAARTAP